MKHIFLNLKRFDILPEQGGVNHLAPFKEWGGYIIRHTQDVLKEYQEDAEFAMFFPEAHLLGAADANKEESPILIGCQGVYREDTETGGDFGAFTTQLTANAAGAAGCKYVLIGHCEERKNLEEIIHAGQGSDYTAVNHLLNMEVRKAVKAGLRVLYCIGEKAQEQDHWQEVLQQQLEMGLRDVDRSRVVIAYEPVWAIGPGKVPPKADYITMIASYVKKITGGMDIVYGGGLKQDNAAMLADIKEIDGGLIALTRFQGGIGFYPEEYLQIIKLYLRK